MSHAMNRVAATPPPPYYAVTTTTQLSAAFDEQAYFSLGARLYRKAQEIPGFLGLEAFFEGGASIAVSYWASLEAIELWRNHPLHGQAKHLAKSAWFGPTITRIARVEADYGFNLAAG
ncbi:antibiotic biosynthesis monooxygenase [Phenylobacterium sp.]|uniref:antibiotic biosynthesis monooxygenase family protein n=1 Tax=Phenylobacterium sp. TaxID=1871053 RepID=UPI002725ECCB|nr:antibiotic biosynthesis monooxygenase [Phenylobacterium sp.]MDO8378208.1 antibiotic biosynthesis monooxygenase [Phenylobacterium sp.]